ncbi:MAG: cobyrinic acid a,c-diamide synthase [Limisphaerales bacterium]|jgi:cobyrinic acid a,c-diamide synthase
MLITKQTVADKVTAYLHHDISLDALVDWAENAMANDEFAETDADVLRTVVPRLGVADVRAFGLAWEDCESLLSDLGYSTRIEVTAS